MRRANPPSRREKPEAAKKILLGGVFPAGDMVKAAELRYAAESLRRVFPKAELHIAGENGVPAYGFPAECRWSSCARRSGSMMLSAGSELRFRAVS